MLEKAPDKFRHAIRQRMQHWQQDADFAGVRSAKALAGLPEAERPAWHKVLADVADLLARTKDSLPSKEKPSNP